LGAQRFDRDIHPFSVRQSPNLCDSIHLRVIDNNVRSHALGHSRTHGIRFNRYDQTRAFQFCSRRGAKADRTLRKHSHRVSDFHVGALRRGNARRGDVSQKHDLLIAQVIMNFGEVRLRTRNQEILGLGSVNGVAEFPSADWPAAL
jgi:aminoglycoside phosphotransferase family enzyme